MRPDLLPRALLAAAVLASSAVSAEASPAADGGPAPQHAVWIQPLLPVIFALGGGTSSGTAPWFHLPVGASFGVSDAWTLEVEASILAGRQECYPDGWCQPFTHLAASAGPSFSLSGSRRFGGFFVQPKATVAHWWTETAVGGFFGDSVLPGVRTTEVILGADAGWRGNIGPLYVASATGIGVGWAAGERNSAFAGPLRSSGGGGSGPVLAITLHLFRVGAAF